MFSLRISIFSFWFCIKSHPNLRFNIIKLNDLFRLTYNKIYLKIYSTNMKIFIALFALVVVVAAENAKYTTKYDGVDLDEIFKSDRLFNSYYKCLADTGRCTPDGSELKRNLPDALRTNCKRCSERQQDGTDRVLRFISKNKPAEWKVLIAKYDPQGIYIRQYSEEALKRGIVI